METRYRRAVQLRFMTLLKHLSEINSQMIKTHTRCVCLEHPWRHPFELHAAHLRQEPGPHGISNIDSAYAAIEPSPARVQPPVQHPRRVAWKEVGRHHHPSILTRFSRPPSFPIQSSPVPRARTKLSPNLDRNEPETPPEQPMIPEHVHGRGGGCGGGGGGCIQAP